MTVAKVPASKKRKIEVQHQLPPHPLMLSRQLPPEVFGVILSFLPVFEQYRILISSETFRVMLARLDYYYGKRDEAITLFWIFNKEAIETAISESGGYATQAVRSVWMIAVDYCDNRRRLSSLDLQKRNLSAGTSTDMMFV